MLNAMMSNHAPGLVWVKEEPIGVTWATTTMTQAMAGGNRKAAPNQRAALGVEVRPGKNHWNFKRGRLAVAIIDMPYPTVRIVPNPRSTAITAFVTTRNWSKAGNGLATVQVAETDIHTPQTGINSRSRRLNAGLRPLGRLQGGGRHRGDGGADIV